MQASAGPQPVNETPIAVNPANRHQLLTGGNDYNCSAIEGYYLTSNGGKTWVRSCGQLISGGGNGDPIVGFDLNGTAYRGGIDSLNSGGTAIIIDSSTDGGQTWSNPVKAATNFYASGLTDKPWLQIDTNPSSPTKNAMYVSVTQFDPSSNSEITVSHSTDGGKTWSMVAIGQAVKYPVVDQFSDLAIGPDGTVYVTWMRCTGNGSNSNCGGTIAQMLLSKSTDGGNTWSAAQTIENVQLAPDPCGAFYGCLPNTGERLSNIPSTGVDESNRAGRGTLYTVAYNYTGAFCQVVVVKSTDGGSTWSAPVAVAPASDTHDQFFPWLNVNGKGNVGVTWMDRRNDPADVNYEEFGAVSTDGAQHFRDFKLARHPSNPNNDGFGGTFMGDYTGNSWGGIKPLYASWTDTSTGIGQDFVGGLRY